jgi:hypothetical protein
MKQRIVEKVNSRGNSFFYPQYRKWGIWFHYKYTPHFATWKENVCLTDILTAKKYLEERRNKPKRVIHPYP